MSPDPRRKQLWRMRAIAASAIALALTACASVPDLGPQPVLRSLATIDAATTLQGSDRSQWPGEGWWTEMGDAQLTALIEAALIDSPDALLAASRVRRADAMIRLAGAASRPAINADAEMGVRKQSANNGFPKQFFPTGWQDNAQMSVNFGYDLDLWGKNRAALAAATSDARAAAVDAAQARLILTTGIAHAYFDLDRLFRQRELANASTENRMALRGLIARRLNEGLENRAALRLADTEISRSAENAAAIDERISLRRNQLAALVGAGPDRGAGIARPSLGLASAGGVPAGIATDLIGRRPDIVAARERVEAAASRIDEARAGFFPSVSLQGLIGLQSLGIGNLLQSDSIFGKAGPAISLPIFQGGALQGRFGTSRADYDAAVAAYNAAVLSAYQEVADAVTRQQSTSLRQFAARDALAASEEASAIVRRRYEGGLANYLDVLTAERGVQETSLAVAMIEADQRSATLALIRALGGGFDSADGGQSGNAGQ